MVLEGQLPQELRDKLQNFWQSFRADAEPASHSDAGNSGARSRLDAVHAVVWNILADHRISFARGCSLLEFWKTYEKADDLNKAGLLEAIMKEFSQSNTGFADVNVNAINQQLLRREVGVSVGRLVNFSPRKMHGVLRLALPPSDFNSSVFVGGIPKYDHEYRKWINNQFRGASEEDRIKRGAALVKLLDPARLDHPNRCDWAVEWTDIWESLVKSSRSAGSHQRCLNAVGVPVIEKGDWVLLLKYELEPSALIRPCQLDAGFFEHHFPSPPPLKTDNPDPHGHPMDLTDPQLPVAWLLNEYIHAPIQHHESHVVDVLQVDALPTRHLDQLRERHWNTLSAHYPQHRLDDWQRKYTPGWHPARRSTT